MRQIKTPNNCYPPPLPLAPPRSSPAMMQPHTHTANLLNSILNPTPPPLPPPLSRPRPPTRPSPTSLPQILFSSNHSVDSPSSPSSSDDRPADPQPDYGKHFPRGKSTLFQLSTYPMRAKIVFFHHLFPLLTQSQLNHDEWYPSCQKPTISHHLVVDRSTRTPQPYHGN